MIASDISSAAMHSERQGRMCVCLALGRVTVVNLYIGIVSIVGICLFGISAMQASESQANVIFISRDGDDRADGSAQAPRKSIRLALEQVAPAGRIVLGSGVWYEGELVVEKSGTAERPLIIEGAGADKTWIAGSRPVTGWTKDGKGVWSVSWETNSQVVACNGVMLQQVGKGCHWHGRNEWDNKPSLKSVGSGIVDVTPGRFFFDEAAKMLYCRLQGDQDPNACLMEAAVDRWIIKGGNAATNVVLRGIGFRHNSGSARGVGSWSRAVILGTESWTVENCAIVQADFAGIEVAGLHHRILGTSIRENGAVGLNCNNQPGMRRTATSWQVAPKHDLLIRNCVITGNNSRGFDYNWHAGGMKIIPAARHVTVADCIVSDNNGHGIWFDTCQGGNIIENNTVERNKAGIFVEISAPVGDDKASAVLRGNLVRFNKEQGVYVSGSEGVLVERNTLWSNWCNLVMHGLPRSEMGSDKQPIPMTLRRNAVRRNLIGDAVHADLIVYVGNGSAENVVDDNFYGYDARKHSGLAEAAMLAGVVRGAGYDINARSVLALSKLGYELHGVQGNPMIEDMKTLVPSPNGPAAGYGR